MHRRAPGHDLQVFTVGLDVTLPGTEEAVA
jgi:hypothetical protein